MRALSVIPGKARSARLEERFTEPSTEEGEILVETLSVGICGTDQEILSGKYGWAPPGEERLILGHESVGRVLEAPSGSELSMGDLVVGIVRHPDPLPCVNCAAGEWDMCRNGQYTEHGIKSRHGFCRERYRCQAQSLVKIDPKLERTGVLVETASILSKAWETIDYIGRRTVWQPRSVLVLGAGPVGLMAALMGKQRGLKVEVFDRAIGGPKPDLVYDLGARYHTGRIEDIDIHAEVIIECTGAGELVYGAMRCSVPGGIVCLTGVSSGSRELPINVSNLNERLVLGNDVIFGSVNSNRRHYESAATSLLAADSTWLSRLLTKEVPLQDWQHATDRSDQDVKNVICLG